MAQRRAKRPGHKDGQSGSVRIVGGEWRSRRLPVPDVEGLRPSGDRLRETLFNWLTPWLPGARCVDLYAGTGALGFEAMSRGAAHVVFVERDRVAVDAIQRSAELLGATASVHQGPVDTWLATARGPFDLAFLDPPYAHEIDAKNACHALHDRELMSASGRVFVEIPARIESFDAPDSWELIRQKRFARVAAWLFAV